MTDAWFLESREIEIHRPRWVDLVTDDPQAAQQFYGSLFGWQMDVSEDPQYGGYAMGTIDGRGAAGIGGKQDPNQPTVWSLYIGTELHRGTRRPGHPGRRDGCRTTL